MTKETRIVCFASQGRTMWYKVVLGCIRWYDAILCRTMWYYVVLNGIR
jgi:hypothetical protein